ncbi:peptide chain release factor N(5)-glutamine methyltransferase [Macrococcus psychrotolerans]|uniref:Release factor glutamine methyltransferase n=1 Tax=Macrococcus psychrotolerans TaxID=3039389 RepID=A0AAT9P6S3_9STAP|nr:MULTISPECIES: peptide chain release factor N(5)-glutamine methyltransferase [Macrococcus]QYA32672.1 peptide chain release factor N(5)-glutamine methyltransferase [Macrococcus sp. 19Msa1099]QYA37485.1 peptide chain release factor N(5)-glutamine methyltransferase [Macrococcus caseolyticus]QYA76192.1 peptide chain release factor N(5)-glutamine methyltransferase [Macrococcus caseolyticus]
MMAYSNLRNLIKEGEVALINAQEPAIGATFLMMDLFALSRTDIMLGERQLSDEECAQYKEGIARLVRHEPLAHITGFQMFYDRKFMVDERVLVPRPETEELVALALAHVSQSDVVADIGTGSGAIAATVQLESGCTMYASDISRKALQVALHNIALLDARVTCFEGDLLQPIIERGIKLDALLSNPPYISRDEVTEMNLTALFDPELALFAEDAGLVLYKRMIKSLPEVMNQGAFIAFEIGYRQADALTHYIHEHFSHLHVNIHKDINGNDRVLWFKWC